MTNNIQITDRGGIYRARFKGGAIVGFGSCPEDAVDNLRTLWNNDFTQRKSAQRLEMAKARYARAETNLLEALRPVKEPEPRTDFGMKLKEAVS